MVARAGSIDLTPTFEYIPWVILETDAKGGFGTACDFVRDISGDPRTPSISASSFSITSISLGLSPQGMDYSAWIPSLRVGSNPCR